MKISNDSLANRRLYMKNMTTLIDFSEADALAHVSVEGCERISVQALPADLVSVGSHGLRTVAKRDSDGQFGHEQTVTYTFDKPLDLSAHPLITFAHSAYDGERDSLYFQEVSENKYFVERPDPLLVSESYMTVTLAGQGKTVSRTMQATNYGFNRYYANFAGETLLSSVEAMSFTYTIEEAAEGWQGVCKLDTVKAGMSVDFTFAGSGMETLFGVEKGRVIHQNGAVTYDFDGEGSSLIFPDMTEAKDTVCDVFLPIKNTVLLRLECPLDTLDVTLAFKTDGEDFYSPDKQKDFTLTGLSEGATVYLNLSDHPKATGRLTGLKLIPHGGKNGTLTIRKLAFEQEKIIRPVSGRFLSCVADTDRKEITVVCEVEPEYLGLPLEIYEIFPHNIHEDPENLLLLASCEAKTSNTLTFPLYGERVSRVSAWFLGAIRTEDGYVFFDSRTKIENWRDICTPNPYAFELPCRDFVVTDPAFGAKGDGYTCDTAAIQKALDAAREAGGGRVIVPGDDSPMGKRYLVTNLRLYSHTELHIEENAVLWQSDDLKHYDRLPRFGHNVAMTGVNWPANHTSGNMPLIYAFREDEVRITGPGMIRMCDTESYSEDGYFRFIGDNVCIGCCDRMHVCPVGIIECEGIEVTDLSIIRSSGVYMCVSANKRGYFGSIYMDESKCTGADGMWPSGSDGMIFTRILLNNNDDGICMSSSYNDPRDMLWYYAYPGTVRGTRNVELSHSCFNCYTFTASAISFCTWGTNAPDLERQEVKHIRIFDTILEGRLSLGGWTDNPYYGKCPFDGSETDDFSPVNHVSIHDCWLKSPAGLGLRITDCDNDFGYHSPSDFEYGDFLRRPAERNPNWRVGLSNWGYDQPDGVGQIQLYEKACAYLKPMRGTPTNLWQGLYLTAGEHVMTFKYKAMGTVKAFLRRPYGEILATASAEGEVGGYFEGRPWMDGTFTFTVPEDGLYHLGVSVDLKETVMAYVTDLHTEAL
ncbi:MAG: hypothetical protein E7661_09515 [Ruminococcaceae bacterium]|nr:hypothetical protein [Oscillospiraceae bacterium]